MNKKPILVNREVSWLHFNARVLQEALDETVPLCERLKFLGIYSNNRDEFFRVRVGTLNRILNLKKKKINLRLDEDPRIILEEVKKMVREQEKVFTGSFSDLVARLAMQGIQIIDETGLSQEQGKFVKEYFHETIRQFLFPMMLSNFENINSLKDGSIYLAVVLKSSQKKHRIDYALVKVPTKSLSRFLILPDAGKMKSVMLLDDAIRVCLGDIFSVFGYDKFSAYTIKLTRDAEIDLDNDISRSFMEIMQKSVKQRKKGIPVRFVYDEKMPGGLLKKIAEKLNISESDNIRSGGRYHNFKDFMAFPGIGPDHLYYPALPPVMHKDLVPNQSFLSVLKTRDIMLHFPYQPFHHIIDLLREASIDPKVIFIKMTFYRAAKYSNVVNALVNASRNGKSVTVFLEIQARFDEEANIILSQKLQDEGVRIIPTIPGYKVHAKLISIERHEEKETVFYAGICTGNFNESTAQIYADDILLTANQEIATEVDRVFQVFEERYILPEFKHLVVSPFYLRKKMFSLIDAEIRNAKAGREAWMIIKINSLVDKRIVRKLYTASQAGVKIRMLVRGICILVPGVRGLSENIEVISIVDRFLEHSRVMIFCNNGRNRYYTGSADWMPRNFDQRIEVVAPVYNKDIQHELWDMIHIALSDNCKARLGGTDPPNQYRKPAGEPRVRSQFAIYDYLKTKHG